MTVDNTELEAGEVVETTEEGLPTEEVVADPFEAPARRMGWRPKDEYRGDETKWVDAKTFVERGERELPIIRERYRKLDDRLVATERKLDEADKRLKESTEVLLELREMSQRSEQVGYQRAMRDLSEKERKAVEAADVAAYDAVQIEKRQVAETYAPKSNGKTPVAPVPAPAAPMPPTNPIIDRWVADNPWYQSNQSLHMYAREVDMEVEREHGEWPLENKLAEVKRRVVAKFPEKFGMSNNPVPPQRRVAPPVSQSSAPPPKPKGKSVRDLPPEAKHALDRFKKTIPGYTDQMYLDLYFAEEA